MRKLLFTAVFLLSLSAFAAEPVGLIVDTAGEVLLRQEGMGPALPAVQQPVYVGDVIETKKTGSLKILFRDDTILTIKENSKTLISAFLFDAKKRERNVVFDVPYGKIRSVVGRFFGEDQPVQIKTPTAVAGIRGTDVGAQVTAKKTDFYCFDGLVYIASIDRPTEEVRLEKGMFTEVFPDRLPSPALPIPQDILQNNMILFDVSLTQPAAPGRQSQVVQSAASDIAVHAAMEAAPGAATAATSVFDSASEAESSAASVLNASPTAASDLGVELIPGGTVEATGPAKSGCGC